MGLLDVINGMQNTEAANASAWRRDVTDDNGVGTGGGLGDLLKGQLGGLLAGGTAGGALSGGLGDLLKQFQQAGQGEVASSWVGRGQNKAIAPKDLSEALGADQINGLMAQTGLSRDELLAGLSEQLPRVVDHLTPDGRLPTEQEMSRLVQVTQDN
jgi:uncharacterized protein YidB (DUF937 family)